jgi:signal transduction histidine kinase
MGVPSRVIVATYPMAALRPFGVDIIQIYLAASILTLAVALIVIYIMTAMLGKPLMDMSRATKKFAAGDFSYRVEVSGNDELTVLSEAFNSMADSLASLEYVRRSFISNVSHELKTPMTTISGFVDGILDGTIPPERQSYYLEIVSDEVKRLSRLVVEMLNISKIEAGEMPFKTAPYNIAEQLFKVSISFEQLIEKKNIEIQLINIDSVTVEADSDLIHQVIYNLVDNAVKFTPEYGCIPMGLAAQNDVAVLRIRNSGAGISHEELPKIFERFYKVDRARSQNGTGAGLGLYIVKYIVEMHGGHISADSVEGQYTEFIFSIPLHKED